MNNADLSLEQESSDFLAALLKEASRENVASRRIVTEGLDTLCELTGINDSKAKDEMRRKQEQ